MELRHMEMVLAISEAGSVTAAAEKLLIAQPSVTAQLRALEEELGHVLFERLPRGMRATEMGEAVIRRSRHIMEEVAEMKSDLDEIAGLRRGHFMLGSIPTLISSVVPTVLVAFHKAYPGITLSLEEARARDIIQKVADHSLHAAIIGGGHTGMESTVQLEALTEEELVVIFPPSDPLAQRDAVALAELSERPFLILETGFGLRTIILMACRRAGFVPQIAMEMESVQAIQSLVRNGFGISIVPQGTVMLEAQHGVLAAVPLRETRLWRPVQLATARVPHVPHSVRAFTEICRSVLGRQRS